MDVRCGDSAHLGEEMLWAGDAEPFQGPTGAARGKGAALCLLTRGARFGAVAQAQHIKAARRVWGSNLIIRLVVLLNEPATN